MSNINHVRQGIANMPEICYRHGVKKVITCPGSRNAPLILSFTGHSSLDCLSITDERSAGYVALGMSQYNGDPVAVVCTSGTAVLNIAPSVAEAYYQNLPLIIITADRPKEWIDQADGQTIRQTNVFCNYIKQSFEVPLETSHQDDLWHFNRTVSQALDVAITFPPGPVHINVPLREPLYTPLPVNSDIPRIVKSIAVNQELSEENLKDFIAKWNHYGKKMIIFGIRRKDENLNKLAQNLAQREDTIVFAENISNIAGKDIIYSPEPLIASLTDEEKQTYKPELLITVGEGIVSKRLKQYLRGFSPDEQWHLSSSGNYTDTYKSLSSLIKVNPVSFLSALDNQKYNVEQPVYSELKKKNKSLINRSAEYLSGVELNDLRVIHDVLSAIPDDSVVHLANSTPIRYSQLSASNEKITYFSNRGTSGIDGCVSTAVGSAYVSGKQVFIITGDLAFIYDSNALWNNYLPSNLKIVVINNNGGNIFSLIESGPEMDKARSYFETPHHVKIKSLAESYGVGYIECDKISALAEKMKNLVQSTETCVLEIKTDSKQNTKVYKEYYKFIKQSII